jgi:peptidoglycan/xylan/chitin deacetylase (PgdA/CDA1 family)
MVGQSLALTLDDGPNLDATPRLSGDDRNHRLLEAFREKGVRVVLFANGIRRGDSPEGIYWLEAWGKAGHRIGNHTYSHQSLEESGPAQFEEDLLRLDRLIRPLPGFWPRLRFPYLLEGKDADERRVVQTMLKKRGYGGAPVSIPTYDWVFNERLQSLLKERPDADLAPLRALYFQHLARMLTGYRDLARRLLGRDPIHSLLLHHNLLNAMVMPDLLRMLEANGWKVVDPEEAYLDPIYAEDLSSAGYHESHLGGLAQKRGLFLADVHRLEAQSALEKANLKGYIH